MSVRIQYSTHQVYTHTHCSLPMNTDVEVPAGPGLVPAPAELRTPAGSRQPRQPGGSGLLEAVPVRPPRQLWPAGRGTAARPTVHLPGPLLVHTLLPVEGQTPALPGRGFCTHTHTHTHTHTERERADNTNTKRYTHSLSFSCIYTDFTFHYKHKRTSPLQ